MKLTVFKTVYTEQRQHVCDYVYIMQKIVVGFFIYNSSTYSILYTVHIFELQVRREETINLTVTSMLRHLLKYHTIIVVIALCCLVFLFTHLF